MKTEQKLMVRDALVRYAAAFDTAEEASLMLYGITPEAVKSAISGPLNQVNDNEWLVIARQVGFYCGDWHTADTSTFQLLHILFGDAQHYALPYLLAVGRGLGKTYSAAQYIRRNENVVYIPCNEHQNRKMFMLALLQAAAIAKRGSMPEMQRAFVEDMVEKDEALLLVDDADKLKNRTFNLLITLANELTGKIGVVIMGGSQLKQRIAESKQLPGINRKVIAIDRPASQDAQLICLANGMDTTQPDAAAMADPVNGFHSLPPLIHNYRSLNMAA